MSQWYRSYAPSWLQRWWHPQPQSRPRSFNPFRPVTNVETAGSAAVLGVRRVELCLEDNHAEHHTNHFYAAAANEALIVRRGEPFRLRIHFNREYSPSKDAISFIFSVADDAKPSPGHGTLNALVPHDGIDYLGDALEWGAGIETHEANMLTVLIKPPATCPVTEWRLDIDTKLQGEGSKSYQLPLPIFVLFNPWCMEDQVYLANREQRKEYVMHDTTLIWRGSYNRLRPSVWKVGQFERHVLECSLRLLGTVGRIPPAYRGDPVRVARALSALVNSVDDDGVLLGNWTEDFSGGTAPTKWTGSPEILQQFHKTQKSVKFAQCWNFSGVLATIARALGIPCRIITCYSSAHDTQASLTVDVFIDAQNRKLDAETTDSIWNYHVWNELWMQRPDLGIGQFGAYDGWQVVDATPQEASDNMYRVGPAAVLAVKHGEILRPFDCGFVYSEVNADKLYWRYNGPAQPLKLLRKDTLAIGHLISTKAVLKWEREDITDSYKYAERSEEERSYMLKALKQSRHAFSRYYLNDNFNEVQFELQLKDDIKVGESFSVVLQVSNKSKERVHQASGQLNCDAVTYTGASNQEVKIMNFDLDLKPESTEHVRMEVSFENYYEKLSSQAAFQISVSCTVKDTDYEYIAQDDFRVRKPDIKFHFGGQEEAVPMVAQKEVDVIVRLVNPLPIPLHKGLFTVEGPGIEQPLKFKIAETPVGGTAAATFKYVPPYAGRGTLVAKFTAKELEDVDGYKHYEIEPRPEDVLQPNASHRSSNIIRRRTDVIA
ncbi:Tg [Drosophila busckii]|uniref:protein-glutamine gamma-glutamyltransferase n=1 Tax=Drosophila busckii TaxID=30019 RepID=A0A0M4EB93_DROBS|nr:annulin isoform X2 [Drosophila busckii]ALC38660.1 Tg [Drosophila busckii]